MVHWPPGNPIPSLSRWRSRQKAASFTLDQALEKMTASFKGGH
jgi:hypothetical protein